MMLGMTTPKANNPLIILLNKKGRHINNAVLYVIAMSFPVSHNQVIHVVKTRAEFGYELRRLDCTAGKHVPR